MRQSLDEDMAVFPAPERQRFVSSYPEVPHKLRHRLGSHPLLELEALARLAGTLPGECLEWNASDQPIGVNGKPAPTGIPIGETIRRIDSAKSWAVLKNVEQDPAYADLLATLLGEIRPDIEARTGRMLKTQAFVFVTSAGGVTPYHFDPEHNILMQVRGSKAMTQFPAGQTAFAPDEVHEAYHTGGGRELRWDNGFLGQGQEFHLSAGEAVYVPVMAPHFVRNGDEPSISLSITWRSEWSFAEADARAFNRFLRRFGAMPKAPGRWPSKNTAKAFGWRALRKLNLADRLFR